MVASIINKLVKYTLLFLFFFLWIYFYNHSLQFSIIISIILSAIVGAFISFIFSKNQKRKAVSLAEKKEIENIKNYLLVSSSKDILSSIKATLKAVYPSHSYNIKGDTLYEVLDNQLMKHFILRNDKTYLTIDDILPYLKDTKESPIIILCISYDKNIIDMLVSIKKQNIKLFDIEDIYFYLVKKYNMNIPKIETESHTNKILFRDLGKILLQRQNFKGYIFSAIILLISSLFIRNSIYYLVSCSVLLVLSALCYFDILHQSKTQEDII